MTVDPGPEPATRRSWRTRLPAATVALVALAVPPVLVAVLVGVPAVPSAVVGTIFTGLLMVKSGWRRGATLLPLLLGIVTVAALTVVFLMAAPTPGVRYSVTARRRCLGTGIAVAVSGIVALLGPPPIGLLGLALLCVFATILVTLPIWANAAFSSLAAILGLAPPGDLGSAGGTRLAATTVAALMVVGGATLLNWWARRHPAREEQVDAVADVVTVGGGHDPRAERP